MNFLKKLRSLLLKSSIVILSSSVLIPNILSAASNEMNEVYAAEQSTNPEEDFTIYFVDSIAELNGVSDSNTGEFDIMAASTQNYRSFLSDSEVKSLVRELRGLDNRYRLPNIISAFLGGYGRLIATGLGMSLWQANNFADELEIKNHGYGVEILTNKTTGAMFIRPVTRYNRPW